MNLLTVVDCGARNTKTRKQKQQWFRRGINQWNCNQSVEIIIIIKVKNNGKSLNANWEGNGIKLFIWDSKLWIPQELLTRAVTRIHDHGACCKRKHGILWLQFNRTKSLPQGQDFIQS